MKEAASYEFAMFKWVFEDDKQEEVKSDITTMIKDLDSLRFLKYNFQTFLPLLVGPLQSFTDRVSKMIGDIAKDLVFGISQAILVISVGSIVDKPQRPADATKEFGALFSFAKKTLLLEKKDLPDAVVTRIDNLCSLPSVGVGESVVPQPRGDSDCEIVPSARKKEKTNKEHKNKKSKTDEEKREKKERKLDKKSRR